LIHECIAQKFNEPVKKERYEGIEKIKQLESKLRDYEEVKRQRDEALLQLKSVDQRSIEILKQILPELPKSPAKRKFSEELLQSGLPKLVEEIVLGSAAEKTDNVITNNLVSRFQEVAARLIPEIADSYAEYAAHPDRLKQLQQKQYAKPFSALIGNWKIPCAKCSSSHRFTIASYDDVAELLTAGEIEEENRVASIESSLHGGKVIASLEEIVRAFLRKKNLAKSDGIENEEDEDENDEF
jgi:hypothetical protein